MHHEIEDSARGYMVSLAQVRAARKLREERTATAPKTMAAAAPSTTFRGPSELDDAIGVLIGVREVLIKLGHSPGSNTIVLIDRVLRRRRANER
jgi:hypothetical protein